MGVFSRSSKGAQSMPSGSARRHPFEQTILHDRRAAPLTIEAIEPRLLLSATLTASTALAAAESLHDNLASFLDDPAATEKFDVFGHPAPTVQISGDSPATVG